MNIRKHLLWILPLVGYLNCFWIYWLTNGHFIHEGSLGFSGMMGTFCAAGGLAIASLMQKD